MVCHDNISKLLLPTFYSSLTQVQREGYIDALWPTSKPNDWTLRNAFLQITESGLIRESIIPLLVNVSLFLFNYVFLINVSSLFLKIHHSAFFSIFVDFPTTLP